MLAAAVAGAAWLVHARFPPPLAMALMATAILISLVEWLGAWLRGLGRVREEAMALALLAAVMCALGLAALARSPGTAALAVSQMAGAALACAGVAAWVIRRIGFRLDPGWRTALPGFWSRAWPVGLSIVLSTFSWRLFYFVTAPAHAGGAGWETSGHYGAAHRLLEAARFLPAAASAALLPALAVRSRRLDPARALRWLLPIPVLIALAALLPGTSTLVMRTVYGSPYAADGPALAVFLAALPCMTVTGVLTHWLIATGHERVLIPLMALHLAGHFAALMIVPALGGLPLDGAAPWALALVFAEAFLAAGTLVVWRRLK